MKTPVITQPIDAPEVPAEIIATSISQIAKSMAALESTRLSRNAIVTLIRAHSGVPKKTIELVMDNLAGLEKLWLKPVA